MKIRILEFETPSEVFSLTELACLSTARAVDKQAHTVRGRESTAVELLLTEAPRPLFAPTLAHSFAKP